MEVVVARYALDRVPLSWIIDDSTALLNLNYFFLRDRAVRTGEVRRWEDLPVVIPEAFTREWAEWCLDNGVRGKFSVVPWPAGLGRVDQALPLLSADQLSRWLSLCRECIVPAFDMTPEMLTHTCVYDLDTQRPRADGAWEQIEWQSFREDEGVGPYMALACEILVNAGIPPQGVTSPGGFGGGCLGLYAQLVGEHCRSVTGRPAPFFFQRTELVQTAIDTPVWYPNPALGTAVGEVIACTGDWTGSWTGYGVVDPDRFITQDLQGGRLPAVIDAGSPCVLLSHWQGMYGLHDGDRRGFRTMQVVVERLRQRDPRGERTIWRKVSDITDYACARHLASVHCQGNVATVHLPMVVPNLTVRVFGVRPRGVVVDGQPLTRANERAAFRSGTFLPVDGGALIAFDPRGHDVQVEMDPGVV